MGSAGTRVGSQNHRDKLRDKTKTTSEEIGQKKRRFWTISEAADRGRVLLEAEWTERGDVLPSQAWRSSSEHGSIRIIGKGELYVRVLHMYLMYYSTRFFLTDFR